jgi:lipoprotein-releasing system permease protein
MPFEWIIALRFLREGRMQTLLIVAGVTIGVAIIIALNALINGLQSSLIVRTLGSQAHVVVRPPEDVARRVLERDGADIAARVEKRAQRLRSIDQWQRIYTEIETTPGVTAVSPMVSGAALAVRGTASKAVVLMGVEAERYARIVKLDEKMAAGEYRIAPGAALIGVNLAEDLGVAVGDKLRVATAEGRDETFTIAGLFDIGTRDLNRRWVFVPLSAARNLLDLPGGVSSIDVTVQEIFSAERIARDIAARTGLLAESWMETNSQLLAALQNQTMTNRMIRFFVVVIVALGIASVLVVSVVQKQKEIGILRAMGTPRGKIMAVFLIQGGVVGAIGSVLGALLGGWLLFALSELMRNADGTRLFVPEVDPATFGGAMLVAILSGLIAAVAPARRAAHMDPVAAIRG